LIDLFLQLLKIATSNLV